MNARAAPTHRDAAVTPYGVYGDILPLIALTVRLFSLSAGFVLHFLV
jgi:hypothetical protein